MCQFSSIFTEISSGGDLFEWQIHIKDEIYICMPSAHIAGALFVAVPLKKKCIIMWVTISGISIVIQMTSAAHHTLKFCVKSQDYDGPCCVTVCSSIFILDGSSEFCTCVLKCDTNMPAWLAIVLSSWQLWGDC